MACLTEDHVKLFCPRTGRLCQDIGPLPAANDAVADNVLLAEGVSPGAVLGLHSRQEDEDEEAGASSPRPHLLILTHTQARNTAMLDGHLVNHVRIQVTQLLPHKQSHAIQARFFVQDTAAETPNADDGFRPYSEHGRAVADPVSWFESAAFAPAVGGLPRDAAEGVYRLFLGERDDGRFGACVYRAAERNRGRWFDLN